MKNKTIKTILIILGTVALIGCIIWVVLTIMAGVIVKGVVDDTKLSAAKTEAKTIVNNVTLNCEMAEFKAAQDTTYINPCADGLTTEEATNLIETGFGEIIDITFENDKVTYLKVKSNGITIEYDGNTYEMVK